MTACRYKVELPPGEYTAWPFSERCVLQVYLPITFHPRSNPSYSNLTLGREIKCTLFDTVTAYPASVY